MNKLIANPKIPLPVRTFAWSLPEISEAGTMWTLNSETWYTDNQIEIEILERARVFKMMRIDVPLMANQNSWIDLVGMTELGIQFFEACADEPLEGK